MKTWSVTTEKFAKKSEEYQIWRLEQLINFGLDNEKISASKLKKYYNKLYIDPHKRNYLKFLLKSLKSK